MKASGPMALSPAFFAAATAAAPVDVVAGVPVVPSGVVTGLLPLQPRAGGGAGDRVGEDVGADVGAGGARTPIGTPAAFASRLIG